MSKFTERWSERAFEGVQSYTQINRPAALQDRVMRLFREAMVARIAEAVGPVAPLERAVDVACGVGDWVRDYLELAEQVVGLDINADFIDEARRSFKGDPRAERVELMHQNAMEFDGFDGADLICFGACLMYFVDEEFTDLLARVSDGQKQGDLVYVRASISDPRGKRFDTEGGVYRLQKTYEEHFRASGYEPILAEHGATILIAYLLSRPLPIGPEAPARYLEPVIRRILHHQSDDTAYFNWLFKKS